MRLAMIIVCVFVVGNGTTRTAESNQATPYFITAPPSYGELYIIHSTHFD